MAIVWKSFCKRLGIEIGCETRASDLCWIGVILWAVVRRKRGWTWSFEVNKQEDRDSIDRQNHGVGEGPQNAPNRWPSVASISN